MWRDVRRRRGQPARGGLEQMRRRRQFATQHDRHSPPYLYNVTRNMLHYILWYLFLYSIHKDHNIVTLLRERVIGHCKNENVN